MMDDDTPVMDPNTGQMAMVPEDDQGPQGPQQGNGATPPQTMGPPPPGAPPGAPPGGPPQQPAPKMRPVTKSDLAKLELDEADKRANRMRDHMDDQLVECRYNSEQRKIILDGCKIGTGVLEGPAAPSKRAGNGWKVLMGRRNGSRRCRKSRRLNTSVSTHGIFTRCQRNTSASAKAPSLTN
jgi:hypothetical protein